VARIAQVGGGACHTGHRSCFYRVVDGGRLRDDDDLPGGGR
jgi:phosphoribosyl-AMP cyclohydrolase